MRFTEEQVKEIVALRESLVEHVDKHQEGIEMLEKNITVLDMFLKDSSFTKASQIGTKKVEPKGIKEPEVIEESEIVEEPAANSIPVKRSNDGKVIANAFVTPDQISIVLEDEVAISSDTPPFKTFFLDRIIGEMKKKDTIEVENGKIQSESVIDCIVTKNGNDIREIIIKNYRQKERINELINTAGWSLSRMLEKIK